MVKFSALVPWRKRATKDQPSETAALLPTPMVKPDTPAGQVGQLIGLSVAALIERRAKRRKAEARFFERWNQRTNRYMPFWTMVTALVGVVGIAVTLISMLAG